jgi:hypothetical protein
MGWTRYLTSQEFHDFANVTQAVLWKGVAVVTRPESASRRPAGSVSTRGS